VSIRSRSRRLLLVAASATLAGVVAWTAGEAIFRWRYLPSYVPDPTLVPDGTLGWDSVPAVAPLEANTGRGPNVVFLGDSFTQGHLWPAEAQRTDRKSVV
jgi:hypothetical protein